MNHVARFITPLTLGTVQIGQSYGIANHDGMPGHQEAMAILDAAWAGGMRSLDTARAYGEAEARIGMWIAARGLRPFLTTKIESIPSDRPGGEAVRTSFSRSCTALGVDDIDGLMMHRASDLHRPEVAATLGSLIDEGRIGGFGVSAYRPEDVAAALAVPGLSMVQVPFNLFDRRMETSGMLARCVATGVTVIARSLFLQGLFFLGPETLPHHLSEAAEALRRARAFAADLGRSLAELAVVAVRDTPGVTSMVLGAEREAQVKEILAMAAAPPLSEVERTQAFAIGSSVPERVFNPGLWVKPPQS